MTLDALVLAIMLALQAPGASIYSLAHVAPDAPASCPDATSLLCARPRWLAARGAWVRPETAAEGTARYQVIAGELAAVAEWATGPGADGWPELPERRWRGGAEPLARALVVVAYHESGFREDVHAGLSAFDGQDTARGDGSRSWCLIQRQLGLSANATSRYPHPRWAAGELVGTNAAATRRCLIVGADVLASAQDRCRRQYDPSPACLIANYGGGGVTKNDKRVRGRVATLQRVERLWRALKETP